LTRSGKLYSISLPPRPRSKAWGMSLDQQLYGAV
jgi:hypothetical protein